MAFSPVFDGFQSYGRPLSHRPSMVYGGSPYSHSGSFYPEGVTSSHGEYPQPAYQAYAPSSNTIAPVNHRLAGSSAYDDIGIQDSCYPDEHRLSIGHHAPMTPMLMPRRRRHSAVSFVARPPAIDPYRRGGSINIKFKPKGSFNSGIGLDEAQAHVRLSGNDAYTFHDLHSDGRRKIHLKIKWHGYVSLTYEIPLDGHDGRVNLQTLARRVSRACVHYLQANVIPVVWDRVVLHHLEEVSYGVWQPMLSTR